MGQRNQRTSFRKRPPLDVGTLGLIQQKLKELASQEEDDEVMGGSAFPNKSASLNLHELLSSLALEQRYSRDINMPSAETVSRVHFFLRSVILGTRNDNGVWTEGDDEEACEESGSGEYHGCVPDTKVVMGRPKSGLYAAAISSMVTASVKRDS